MCRFPVTITGGAGGGDASAANQLTQIGLATDANTKLDTIITNTGSADTSLSEITTDIDNIRNDTFTGTMYQNNVVVRLDKIIMLLEQILE